MRISESPPESPISAMFQSKMTRTFHPVGQGAFYSERFYCGTDNVCNVVYDCGTQTNHNNLSKIIGNAFPTINGEKQKINYLFISHFHEDHINGIKMLLNQCAVQNLVIPAIKNKGILLCDYIHNVVRSNNWDNEGNWLLEGVFSEPNTDSFHYYENQGISIVRCSVNSEQGSVPQGTNVITEEKMGWEYLMYCSESGKWNAFITNFDREFPTVYQQFEKSGFFVIKDFFSNSPNDFGKLKDLYNKYYKNPKKNDNYYSMAVLSKPVCSDEKTDEMMCLYTGDYPARDNKCLQELKTYYDGYWKDFKTMQVPHHGSRYDNPKELYDISGRHCVYSYGTNNRFHHPCGKMLSELLIKQESLIPVNEDKRYEKNFEYR